MSEEKKKGIYLGNPLDQLLNDEKVDTKEKVNERENGKKEKPKREENQPGIILPTDKSPGSGNIIICGRPGSGKSTLALQIATACVKHPQNENIFSAYISLEEDQDRIKEKAKMFGWKDSFRSLKHLHDPGEYSTSINLGNVLKTILTQPKDCPFQEEQHEDEDQDNTSNNKIEPIVCPKKVEHKERFDKNEVGRFVLLPSLSPRHISNSESHGNLFWERYQQLERLLMAAKSLGLPDNSQENPIKNEEAEPNSILPQLKLVCIDSLNMFGSEMPGREELFRIFDLFRRSQIIGVFVVETSQPTPFDSTLADVVIRLHSEEDSNYFVRYLEIEKSRYTRHIYGKHFFKTVKISDKEKQTDWEDRQRTGCVISPSLHYVVSQTTESLTDDKDKKDNYVYNLPSLIDILPASFERGSVLAIEGPLGTFKTTLALNILAAGLVNNENALFIHLHDQSYLKRQKSQKKPYNIKDFALENFKGSLSERLQWDKFEIKNEMFKEEFANNNKRVLNEFRYNNEVSLIEASFKTGAIFPEEFIQIIEDIFILFKDHYNYKSEEIGISRVVLDDVSLLGLSYPFLKHSKTTGDLFLSCFVHIMRNKNVDLVITGTTGDLNVTNEPVYSACALADTVLSCRLIDIFGDRHVVIKGEGLLRGKVIESEETAESAPAVLKLQRSQTDQKHNDLLIIDKDYLKGIVGFEEGKIHRPGITFYLFEENPTLHRKYNNEIETFLQTALVCPLQNVELSEDEKDFPKGKIKEYLPTSVSLIPFDSSRSEAVHDSINLLKEGPFDRTILLTFDEFWLNDKNNLNSLCKFTDNSLKDINQDDYLPKIRKSGLYVPYYSNVLLLAYRKDIIEGWREKDIKSWKEINDIAQNIGTPQKDQSPLVSKKFWYDISAHETLSCALIDAIRTKSQEKDIGKILNEKLNDEQIEELQSLHELLFKIFDKPENLDINNNLTLPQDAAIYLCWYSQLRELIDRCPELSEKLDVFSLPGGGIKGDWFIGIIKGSVSITLGQKVIKALTETKEEYKRFARGVGLPARKLFYEGDANFFAWPNGKHVPLTKIREIYDKTSSRSSLDNYDKYRTILYTISFQLTPLCGRKEKLSTNEINEIVNRISSQRKILAP